MPCSTPCPRDQLDLLPKAAAAFKRHVAEEDGDVVGIDRHHGDPARRRAASKPSLRNAGGDFGRKIFLIEQVDPSIVGGLVLDAASVVTFPSRRSCASRRRPSQTLLIRYGGEALLSETLNAQDIAKKLQEQLTSLLRDGRYA